jgi:hypothetical protein
MNPSTVNPPAKMKQDEQERKLFVINQEVSSTEALPGNQSIAETLQSGA